MKPYLAELIQAASNSVTKTNWQEIVRQRLAEMDWEAAVTEVRPFLTDTSGVELLNRPNVMRLLGRGSI